MTMEQFLMLMDETFEDYSGPLAFGYLARVYGPKKKAFRTISNYRWAIRELERYVENHIGNPYEPKEVYKYLEIVIDFEYQMDIYSKVNPDNRIPFENARNVAEEIEDILNAML